MNPEATQASTGSGLLLFLVASIAVIGLTYWVSRMLGTWQVAAAKGRRLRVLEGVPVGRDRQLLLVKVGKEVLVLGSSTNGVNLVHRITDPETVEEMLADQPVLPEGGTGFDAAQESIRSQLAKMRQLVARAKKHFDA